MQGLKRHDLKGEKRKGLGRGFKGESGTGRRSWDIIMTGSQVVTLGGGAMMVLYVRGVLLVKQSCRKSRRHQTPGQLFFRRP